MKILEPCILLSKFIIIGHQPVFPWPCLVLKTNREKNTSAKRISTGKTLCPCFPDVQNSTGKIEQFIFQVTASKWFPILMKNINLIDYSIRKPICDIVFCVMSF